MTREEILKKLRDIRGLEHIQRYRYKIDTSEALMTIETIGQARKRSFVIDADNRFAYENFAKWCNCDDTMQAIDPVSGEVVQGNLFRGIYIAGGTGTGKSWCLDVMRMYCRLMDIQVLLSKAKDKNDRSDLWWQSERADVICESFMQTGSLAEYRNNPLLGIQDLGSEPLATLYMGNRVEVLKYLLESRGDETDMLTFITSNIALADKSLAQRYGDRVASRLREMCNYLEIRGADRRL